MTSMSKGTVANGYLGKKEERLQECNAFLIRTNSIESAPSFMPLANDRFNN